MEAPASYCEMGSVWKFAKPTGNQLIDLLPLFESGRLHRCSQDQGVRLEDLQVRCGGTNMSFVQSRFKCGEFRCAHPMMTAHLQSLARLHVRCCILPSSDETCKNQSLMIVSPTLWKSLGVAISFFLTSSPYTKDHGKADI